MRAVVQRVRRAEVRVGNESVGRIAAGFLILLGVTHADGEREAALLARKLVTLRIFEDENGKMNRSIQESGGQALVVSQFTLYGDVRNGRRPSFINAARPEEAAPLYEHFCALLGEAGLVVATGRFGAHMEVELVNDGPVTLYVDTADLGTAG